MSCYLHKVVNVNYDFSYSHSSLFSYFSPISPSRMSHPSLHPSLFDPLSRFSFSILSTALGGKMACNPYYLICVRCKWCNKASPVLNLAGSFIKTKVKFLNKKGCDIACFFTHDLQREIILGIVTPHVYIV